MEDDRERGRVRGENDKKETKEPQSEEQRQGKGEINKKCVRSKLRI